MPAKSMLLFMRAGNVFYTEPSSLAANEEPTEPVLSEVAAAIRVLVTGMHRGEPCSCGSLDGEGSSSTGSHGASF